MQERQLPQTLMGQTRKNALSRTRRPLGRYTDADSIRSAVPRWPLDRMQGRPMVHVLKRGLRQARSGKRLLRISTTRVFFRPTTGQKGPSREINVLEPLGLIKLQTKLNGTRMQALVDSGSQANYVSAHVVARAGLEVQRKQQPYPLHVANGEPMPNESEITHEVRQVTLSIQEHVEEIDLDVIGLATHDIILGLPWLRKHNPRIDWKSKVF